MRDRYIILILIISSLALTLPGLKGNLPSLTVSDEFQIVERALHCGTGDFNPHLFTWPAQLPVYMLFIVLGILFVVLKVLNVVITTHDYMLLYLENPTVIYITSRLFSIILSTLSIPFIYLMASRIANRTTAIFASVILITSPLFIRYSHLAKPEAYLLLFTSMALFFIYRNHNLSKQNIILSAIFTGTAISTKYNALLIIPAVIAYIFIQKTDVKSHIRLSLMFVVITTLSFLIFSPFIVIDHHSAIGDIKTQIDRAREVGFQLMSSLRWFAVNISPRLITPVIIPFALLGFMMASRERKLIPLILLVLLNIAIIVGRYVPPHYLIVSLPPIAIIGGNGLQYLFSKIKRKNKYIGILFISFIGLFIAIPTFIAVRKSAMTDTREMARQWIEENLTENSAILIDRVIPDVESPQLIPNPESAERLSIWGRGNIRFRILISVSKEIKNRRKYNLYLVSMAIKDVVSFIEGNNIKYVITSVFGDKEFYIDQCLDYGVETYPCENEYHRILKEKYKLIKNFSPDGKITRGPEVLIYITE